MLGSTYGGYGIAKYAPKKVAYFMKDVSASMCSGKKIVPQRAVIIPRNTLKPCDSYITIPDKLEDH